jgi:hypothetical protein
MPSQDVMKHQRQEFVDAVLDEAIAEKRIVGAARELSVGVLTNTAVAEMLGPFPNAVRDVVYGSIKP